MALRAVSLRDAKCLRGWRTSSEDCRGKDFTPICRVSDASLPGPPALYYWEPAPVTSPGLVTKRVEEGVAWICSMWW
jgi:hypothetical protein